MKYIEEIDSFLIDNQDKIGLEVKIKSMLSDNKTNFDRHFVTYTYMKFKLEDLRWRFSGARLFLDNLENLYEIAIDKVVEFEKCSKSKFVYLEKYSDNIYRRTEIEFLSK